MPNRDGTGPMGQGPLTGRGFGPCCPQGRRGRSRGFGRGFGWGLGRGFAQPVELTKKEQKEILIAELKDLEAERDKIKKTLKELK